MIFFNELKRYGRKHYPAILLDHLYSHRTRIVIREIAFFVMLVTFILMLFVQSVTENGMLSNLLPAGLELFLVDNIFRIRGMFLIFSVFWLETYWVESFYLSHYFRKEKVDYEVAKLAYLSKESDITGGFLSSGIGKYTFKKLGVQAGDLKSFLNHKNRIKISEADLKFHFNARKSELDDKKVINLPDYVKAIYDVDYSLQNFLKNKNITEDEFFGALEWVHSIYWKDRNSKRYWSRENLIRIPSIGKHWNLDSLNYVDKFSHLIYEDDIYKSLGRNTRIFEEEALKLEKYLLDKRLNNVMIVSDKLTVGMQIVSTLGRMIITGNSNQKFEHKKIYVLSVRSILAESIDEKEVSLILTDLVNQIEKHEDVILVIPNLAEFTESLISINLDSVKFLKNILQNKDINIIALTTEADYFSIVEPDQELGQYFDKLKVRHVDHKFILRVLEDEACRIEKEDGTVVTFQVLDRLSKKYLLEKNPIDLALKELRVIYSE